LAATILDGKALAQTIRAQVAQEAAVLTQRLGRPPGLDVILVGQDPASSVYVKNKNAACRAAGLRSDVHRLPADVSQGRLLGIIDTLNDDPAVDGILVQLPLPRHINDQRVIERVDPQKDVDGFHPENVGALTIGRPRFVPCTPLGIQRLIISAGIPTRGAHAVVLGRSNIVGKPMALLLMQKGDGADATVTVCHTATRDAAAFARSADILIVAMGQPEQVGRDWIKPGAAVIDVGIHRRPDGTLCGDVKADEARVIAGWLSPVPGGVGPLTVAMLLSNTLQSARARLGAGA
jgi:methylenetetrahydrofolate dehydrogenase (NADP+)/methenyltetrahydrofolate cyclohydrolase